MDSADVSKLGYNESYFVEGLLCIGTARCCLFIFTFDPANYFMSYRCDYYPFYR